MYDYNVGARGAKVVVGFNRPIHVKAVSALLLCSFFAATLLAGCDYARSLMRPVDLTERAQGRAGDPTKEPLDLDTFTFPDDSSETAYKMATTNALARDRLQDTLIKRSNVACAHFQDDMFVRVAGRKVALKTTALLTGTAAAIVQGGLASSILAGVGAAAIGTDAIMDAEILQEQLITIIVAQMDTSRATILSEIEGRRVDQGGRTATSVYSVDQAVRDAGRYHVACGFLPAIVALADKAKTPTPTRASLDAQKKALEMELSGLETKLGGPLAADTRNGYIERVNAINQRLSVLDSLTPLVE